MPDVTQDDEKTLLIKEITAELSDKSCGELILLKVLAEAILQAPKVSSSSKTHHREGKRTGSKSDNG